MSHDVNQQNVYQSAHVFIIFKMPDFANSSCILLTKRYTTELSNNDFNLLYSLKNLKKIPVKKCVKRNVEG